MTKQTITKFLLLLIAFTLALSANYIFAAWVGPTQAPPGGNTDTPVHIGTINQVKDGGLSLNALTVFGNGYFQGTLGINEVVPSTGGEQDLLLDVEGAIGAKYYCDEDGNNCVAGDALDSGGGTSSVTKIIAGNNISLNPSSGTGDVSISTKNFSLSCTTTTSSQCPYGKTKTGNADIQQRTGMSRIICCSVISN